MREAEFTRRLINALKAHQALVNAVVWKHADSWNRGIPDLSVSVGARTIWAEVKMDGNQLTKIQRYYVTRLREGAITIVAMKDGRSAFIYPGRTTWQQANPLVLSDLVDEIAFRCADGA